jgi:hypothetical protein
LEEVRKVSKKKNKSKKYKDGRVVQTRDEFLSGNSDYRKPGMRIKVYIASP